MLDGHSFSSCDGGGLDTFASELDGALAAYGSAVAEIEFQLDTPRAVLVPDELYTPESGLKYLAANNIVVGADECDVVTRSSKGDIVAVVVWDRAQIDYLNSRFGPRAKFSTPLLRRTWHSGRMMSLLLTPSNVYVNVFDGRMRYAEAFPARSAADVVYYMEMLDRVYPLREWPVSVSGENARDTVRAVRKYFGRVRIEIDKRI